MPQSSFSLEVNPAVLRWARESAGQTTAAVAERLAVSEHTIEEWETGKQIPDWRRLRKLARQYQRPLAALLLPEPPQEPELPPDFRTVPGARRELSSQARLAIRTARWLQDRAIELHEQLALERRFSANRVRLTEDPAAAAQEWRRSLGVSLEEQTGWKSEHEGYRRWRQALEDQGVLVFQFRLAVEEIRGFSLFHPVVPAITTNESDAVQARIFTLFHEYAHLLLGEPGICLPNDTGIDRGAGVETFCNRFAAAILIPPGEVRSWGITAKSDRELKNLARRYRVSKYVILGRLRAADAVSETAYRQIANRWKSQGELRPPRKKKPAGGGPSAVDTCLRQRGNSLVSLVLEGVRRGAITAHDGVTYLGVTLKDLDKLESKRE